MGFSREVARRKRHVRRRRRIVGTVDRPRLVVFRSLHHISAQVIDDSRGFTLASASTQESEIAKGLESKTNSDAAAKIGALVGERAKTAGISTVVYDTNGNKYHGRVQALADAARAAGLEF